MSHVEHGPMVGTGPTVFNGFVYQFTIRKSLKTIEKVSIFLQIAVCHSNLVCHRTFPLSETLIRICGLAKEKGAGADRSSGEGSHS